MKRICLYLTYDREHIIDRYIGYMLKELRECSDYLVVICNETDIAKGREILERYADRICCRENIGFDAGGFRDALCELVGWNTILQYDELILANDSMFGPFRPMKEIFSQMDQKDVDFWGLSKHGECCKNGLYIPEHIQSFFLVIRSAMLRGQEFRQYWEGMPYYSTHDETVMQYETKFTSFFSQKGYQFAALADTESNDSSNIENNYLQYSALPLEMIQKRNFPFLKRRIFSFNMLDYQQTQQELKRSIEYIEKSTAYNVDLIWENLIRTMDVSDLQRNLHLQYVISPDGEVLEARGVLIAVFVRYGESAEYVKEYLKSLSINDKVKIFAGNRMDLKDYEETGLECRVIREDDWEYLISEFSSYEYVCVLHDADLTSDRKPSRVGKSYFYYIWENLLKDDSHVSEILSLFAREPRLGFLAAPCPDFGEYVTEYGIGWDGRWKEVEKAARDLKLCCRLSEHKPPFRVTEDFWIRGCILEKLKGLGRTARAILPYLWGYLSQDAGYYSGIVESMEYASMHEVNLQYYLQNLFSRIRGQYGDFHNFAEMKRKLSFGALGLFCKKYSRIFVYGVGEMERVYRRMLPDIEAYVVSDGRKKADQLNGIPIIYLSEVEGSDDCGVVLCLDERNQREVIPLLKKYGIKNYLCL